VRSTFSWTSVICATAGPACPFLDLPWSKKVSRSCQAIAFGLPGFLRISYTLGEQDLIAGLGRLKDFLARL
jgi:hypothetical protein